MAEYIESFGSKLDWAMPFQRTGKFPLDRTSMFSSYADALAYAKQDGTDSRQLGGTSYVGQPITVYGKGFDGATDEVALYIITAVGEGAALQKLAQSSASGDVEADIAALQARCSEIEADIVKINGKLVVATTSTDGLMAAADKTKLDGIAAGAQANVIEVIQLNGSPLEVAAKTVNINLANYATKQDLTTIPKFAIQVVEELPTQDISTTTVYLVLQEEGEQSGQDIYNEYIYVNNTWELIGNTDIDLSSYATTEAMNAAIQAAVADMATQTWVTGQLGSYATTEALTSGLAGKADTTTVSGINGRLTTAEGEIDSLQADIATKLNESQVDARIQAATIQASKVSGKVAAAAQADNAAKVTNALTVGEKTFDGSAAVEILASDIGAATPEQIGEITINVGETLVATSASGAKETVKFIASGSNVHITGDAEEKTITIAVDEQEFNDTNRGIKAGGVEVLAPTNKTAVDFVGSEGVKVEKDSAVAGQVNIKLADGSVTEAKLEAGLATKVNNGDSAKTAVEALTPRVTAVETALEDKLEAADLGTIVDGTSILYAGSKLKVGKVNVNQLEQTAGDTLILNGGNA